jgi:hypothetical protein
MNDPMTLGELIARLEACAPSKVVRFPFCSVSPADVGSYRGYYDQLAVEWTDESVMTVADFLTLLRNAVGATFEGYKGGEYRMTRDTPVWVANYGRSDGTGITGVHEGEFDVLLAVANCNNYGIPWRVEVGNA